MGKHHELPVPDFFKHFIQNVKSGRAVVFVTAKVGNVHHNLLQANPKFCHRLDVELGAIGVFEELVVDHGAVELQVLRVKVVPHRCDLM